MSVDEGGDRVSNLAAATVQAITAERQDDPTEQNHEAIEKDKDISVQVKLENKVEKVKKPEIVEKEGGNNNSAQLNDSELRIEENTAPKLLYGSENVSDMKCSEVSVNEPNKVAEQLETLQIEEQIQAHITERAISDTTQIDSADGKPMGDTDISNRTSTEDVECEGGGSDTSESLCSRDDCNENEQLDSNQNKRQKKQRLNQKRRKKLKERNASTEHRESKTNVPEPGIDMNLANTSHTDGREQYKNNPNTLSNDGSTKGENNKMETVPKATVKETTDTVTQSTEPKASVKEPNDSVTQSTEPKPVFGEGRRSENPKESYSSNDKPQSSSLFHIDSTSQNENDDKHTLERDTGGTSAMDMSPHPGVSEKSRKPKNKEKEKDKKEQSNKTTKQDSKTDHQGKQNSKGATNIKGRRVIQVHFHVLVSPDLKYQKGDRLILRLENRLQELGGGWSSDKLEMKPIREHDDGYVEFGLELDFPVRLIQELKQYKYFMIRVGKDRPHIWDHYVRHSRTGADVNRFLNIPKQYQDQDVWHQFDGVMNREPKGVVNRVKDFWSSEKKLANDAEIALKIFGGEMVKLSDSHTLMNVVQDGELLVHCLRRIYLTDGRVWTNEVEFMNVIGGGFLKLVFDAFKTECSSTSVDSIDRKLLSALAVICVVKNLKMRDVSLSDEEKTHICQAVLLKPVSEGETCREVEIVDQYFPKKRKSIVDAMVNFAKCVIRAKNISWLYMMPLIHLLSDECKPFQDPGQDVSHARSEPKWWGISCIERHIFDDFKKQHSKWIIPMQKVIDTLHPLFELDYLLPRSLMATLQLKEVKDAVSSQKIPVEICCATLYFFIKDTRPTYSYWSATTDEQVVFECMNSLSQQLTVTSTPELSSPAVLNHWRLAYRISAELLTEALVTNRGGTASSAVSIFLACVSVFDTIQSKTDIPEKKSTRQNQSHMDWFSRMQTSVIKWLDTHVYSWYTEMLNSLQWWNRMFIDGQLQSKKIQDEWNTELGQTLAKRLEGNMATATGTGAMEQFIQIYCQNIDEFKVCMQEFLNGVAFKAIEKGYGLSYGGFNDNEKRRFGNLLSTKFETEWGKAMSKTAMPEEERILTHVLSWSPCNYFLQMFCTDKSKFAPLSENCDFFLVQAVSVIDGVYQSLVRGSVTVGRLQQLQEPPRRFPELVTLASSGQYSQPLVEQLLRARHKEYDAFEHQAEWATTLAALCHHYIPTVNVKDLDTVMDKMVNVKVYAISEFCCTVPVTVETDLEAYMPMVTAFPVSDGVLRMLPQLHDYNKSNVFLTMWEQQCTESGGECSSLDDVVSMIWEITLERWHSLSRSITNGHVHFGEFEKQFGKLYKDDFKKMVEEMQIMDVNVVVARKRTEQLAKHRQLKVCVKGANVLLDFAKQYNLHGDFHQVRQIASHGCLDIEMKSFDDSLMKITDILRDITPEKAKCLRTFVKCGQLVQWLQQSMKKVKELKVFVDLAFISAGDQPMDIDRVQCLHSAVTGFAPLIFDLHPEVGYQDLLKKCQIVWRELESDPKLPQKLVDTNRELEWLKTVQKAHGSVEVTSLSQSKAINSSGIYEVGYIHKVQEEGTMLDLPGVLKLTVREEKEGESTVRHRRRYTYDQIQDLQSRLMLVAGKAEKGTDDVDRFTEIYDSVTRLSNVYIELNQAGCVLFKTWTASMYCDPTRPVSMQLQFGQDVPEMRGRAAKDEDVRIMIPKLAQFLERCLDEWLGYISEKRNEYLHLNYFTVDQLVLLQRELVKVGTDAGPNIGVYPLLSAVKVGCTPADLIAAMKDAHEYVKQDEEMTDNTEGAEPSTQPGNGLGGMGEVDDRQQFIAEMLEAGYEEHVAIKALEHVPADDTTEGVIWCMDYVERMESVEEITDDGEHDEAASGQQKLDDVPGCSWWSASDRSVLSIASSAVQGLQDKRRDVGIAPLIKDLQELWTTFLDSISSNLQDYLSLEHLGLILRCLAARNTEVIQRHLPPGFHEEVPNLIVCPSGDILMSVLSLYMMDGGQPLPRSDEVLMCTSDTTLDQVDIFWRRALFGGGAKIHCLVNGDLLNFDVSDRAEQRLEYYMQKINHLVPRYRLVVVCSSNNENQSRIVSALDKYRRPTLPVNIKILKNYISEKLQVTHSVNKVKPAAYVDFENVRVIKSARAGVGKTLYKKRREAHLFQLNPGNVTKTSLSIPLQERRVDMSRVIQRLLHHTAEPGAIFTRLIHIDVSHEVQEGVDYLLFNLLVLGCLTDQTGYVWRRSASDLYLIETMHQVNDAQNVHHMLNILPEMTCWSPQKSLSILNGDGQQPREYKPDDQLFDTAQFEDPVFQRPFQYLLCLDQGRPLNIHPYTPEGTPGQCLQVLLRHCGIVDPSWAELHHFVWFLNTQLGDFEENNFVHAAEDLPGFAVFVLRFLIQMSRDFSTRSLDMSEECPGMARQPAVGEAEDGGDDLQPFQLRRTWESSPHPYLFFNSDRGTFTFLGFYIERQSGNLIDLQTRQVLEPGIMQQNLYDGLIRNFVPLQENFDNLPRIDKIARLCSVIGMEMPYDPDPTYELTTDNVKKILAIYMRFRCDIPVIIMGETGCGKTRLIQFMCSLQVPPGTDVTNMILMKVHGGTTNADIIKKVHDAEKIALVNVQKYGEHMYTVLFFDEANTTEAIGLIKEIMCDKTMEGERLRLCDNLKMVAACNPYRKHSEELIKRLEQAGLGYHVDAEDTTDKLGRVPMRRLVYRVQPLPQSLLPLVWDFGQLNTQVEDLYIRQMVLRYINEGRLPNMPHLVEEVSAILTASQDYMRQQQDECSFVSLRDVDRVLSVMSWFHEQSGTPRTLYDQMDRQLYGEGPAPDSDTDEEEEEEGERPNMGNQVRNYWLFKTDQTAVPQTIQFWKHGRIDDLTRSLVLALGVCYHACLKTRDQYRAHIARHFTAPCQLAGGPDQMEQEIMCCQDVFLSSVQLEKNIARNMALKENLFMMVVCIELRIPLFLVGKPGSSKSLAKTIVSDAMQGNAAHTQLFKELKQAQMVSFQCSPLSTPHGIVGTFRQCAQFQKDKDLNSFVSIVVLDEVGLAEDSPRMPLKTLHPLLEDGCQGDEKPEPYRKVAFIGISNWALDPAKMNRGILVQREVPDLEELINSANGICTIQENMPIAMKKLMEPMAKSYLDIFKAASKREFFGLRDFYSLVKMVFAFAEKSKQCPNWHEMEHAVKRNFGGLDDIDPMEKVKGHLKSILPIKEKALPTDPDCTAVGLIHACLFDAAETESESRYLLLLTENYGALSILQQILRDVRPITIFGSSFPKDQEYTQVCRNINKIKVCMETGNTVVLLNLENLYESLYDALNQYYVYFGGERYVDLGLGTHRVKCRVHRQFRLIVVAEKEAVYTKFPTPLINRLEKHFLTINTMLTHEQRRLADTLEHWAKEFAQQKPTYHRVRNQVVLKAGDVFMGYHDDTCAAIIRHVWNDDAEDEEILNAAKQLLLWCATPDAVVRLEGSRLPQREQQWIQQTYNRMQTHDNISQYLHFKLQTEACRELLAQVTTHSKLLSASDKMALSKETGIAPRNIMLETLQSFDTEQQFSSKIKSHIQVRDGHPKLLIVQCDSGDMNGNLVASARYSVLEQRQTAAHGSTAPVHVVFVIQLPRIAGGCFTGFQCGEWHSVHIDELRDDQQLLPNIHEMQTKSVATLVEQAVAMETDEFDMDVENSLQREPMEQGMDWESERLQEPGSGVSCEELEPNLAASSHHPVGTSPTPTHPMQIDDVVYQLQHPVGDAPPPPDDLHGQIHAGPKLDVHGLILSCVHMALAMMKDKDSSAEHAIGRIGLLLTLLHQNGDPLFLQGVSKLIASLLKEKEEKLMSAHMATGWLIDEAARQENTHKAGTFRRACMQYLESKVAPILADIIAYIDTNNNLDLLKQDVLPWKQQMWLGILNTTGAMQLKYGTPQSLTKQRNLQEIGQTTRSEGQSFTPSLPFSWLVHDQMADIVNNPLPGMEAEEQVDTLQRDVGLVVRVFSKTPLGHLGEIYREGDPELVEEIQQAYLSDFVHMEYRSHCDVEHKLVCQSVEYLARRLQRERDTESVPVLDFIANVHLSHKLLAARLTYFHTMNQVWPDCSTRIWELKTAHPDHYMFQDQETFTFMSLCLLIESLAPLPKQLDDIPGRARWLDKVHKYRPVVEKVISLHNENPETYGSQSHRIVMRAKCLWTRVVAMKLFLQHVCTVGSQDTKLTVNKCMPFWKLLGEEADLKEVQSLEAVERFLKLCNRTALKEYMGKQQACSHCEKPLEGPPIVLPCKDAICETCYMDVGALGRQACPKCSEEIPEGFSPNTQTSNSKAITKLKVFQKCCNAFFMDLVSQLCFADNSPPSDAVVDKLLGYITQSGLGETTQLTKQMTIFSIGLDPNPVFRSFLLQLLMRTSEELVEVNLEKYLRQASGLLGRGDVNQTRDQQYTELCLMVIQCLEDLFNQELGNSDIRTAIMWLKHARPAICVDVLNVEKLYGLARARAGLVVCAKYVCQIVRGDDQRVPPDIRKLLEAAQALCEGPSEWPKTYLVKCLCRGYGVDVYQKVCRSQHHYIRWLADVERDQVMEGPDRYVVCGAPYTTLRESLTRVILGENVENLQETLTQLETAGGHIEVMLHLAIHREITCSNVYSQDRCKVSPGTIDVMQKFCAGSKSVKNKPIMDEMLRNILGAQLTVQEGEGLREQGLQCLVIHMMAVLSHVHTGHSLLQPFIGLFREPEKYAQSYLPTMPEDNVAEVKAALLAARDQAGGENPFMYRCPNGHVYVIGNCGRPAVVDTCRECGASIGGLGYNQLAAGNMKDEGTDGTKTGHILGRAEARGRVIPGERSLSPSATMCLRMLTHIAMYLGTKTNTQAVWSIIQPQLELADVSTFLWDHIDGDMDNLARILGQNVDDVLLFLHTVIRTAMVQHGTAQLTNDRAFLQSKQARKDWEQQFVQAVVGPALLNMDNILNDGRQQLLDDQRLGADPLLGMLYEIDTPRERIPLTNLQDVPAVWRFRSRISMESLCHEFDTKHASDKKSRHTVLREFLKQEPHLRALHYVPGVLRLQRTLVQRYQRKLDRAEASTITVGKLKQDDDVYSLLEEFGACWELVRERLEKHAIATETGVTMVPKEYCRKRITDDTPVSWLLPSTRNEGLCSFALLDFLLRKQNEFLDKYLGETKRKVGSLGTVRPMEVTHAHLISYDPQADILPLVLANCQYSFEIGKGTKIEYDFTSLERQIIDRFLYSKSKIETRDVLAIDQMIYRAEYTNSEVFNKLRDKIPQERLSAVTKRQICEEVRCLPDLCQSLGNLDICISFLTSIGGDPEHSLLEFMANTLQMTSPLHSQKAGQMCQFKHTQSLWMLLALHKTQKLADYGQHRHSVFESAPEKFHGEPEADWVAMLDTYLWELSIDKLTALVDLLHEFIVIVVLARTNKDDDDGDGDYTESMKLRDGLIEYDQDGSVLDSTVLETFPDGIQYGHAVNTWLTAYDVLKGKQSGRRR